MERNKLARQIIDTCLEMTRLGLNQGTAGNVSVRYQDGMLITPTGIPAVEKLKNFELLHGQCVALGTIAAAYISFKRGCLSTEEFYEIRDMNVGFDLPIFFNGLDNEAVLQTTKSDKKMDNGKIKFILLKKIGQAYIDKTVTDEEILDAIQFINGDMIEGE